MTKEVVHRLVRSCFRQFGVSEDEMDMIAEVAFLNYTSTARCRVTAHITILGAIAEAAECLRRGTQRIQ